MNKLWKVMQDVGFFDYYETEDSEKVEIEFGDSNVNIKEKAFELFEQMYLGDYITIVTMHNTRKGADIEIGIEDLQVTDFSVDKEKIYVETRVVELDTIDINLDSISQGYFYESGGDVTIEFETKGNDVWQCTFEVNANALKKDIIIDFEEDTELIVVNL